jgi:hypothetical protein
MFLYLNIPVLKNLIKKKKRKKKNLITTNKEKNQISEESETKQ